MKRIRRLRMDDCFCTIHAWRQMMRARRFSIALAALAAPLLLIPVLAQAQYAQPVPLWQTVIPANQVIAINFSGDDAWRVANEASLSGALGSAQGNAGANVAAVAGTLQHDSLSISATQGGVPVTHPGSGNCGCACGHP